MPTRFNSVDDIIDFILSLWKEHNIALGGIKRENVPTLPRNLLTLINDQLDSPPVYTQTPIWIAKIDAYFQEQERILRQQKYSSGAYGRDFIPVCTLLTPLVYFDDILRLRSFNDGFLRGMELTFMTRLKIPRDLVEARRIYDAILQMPNTSHLISQVINKVVNQPFRAQMMFASLIMREAEPHSGLWQFQKKCLESCPARLLDYPGYHTAARTLASPRPSFWMAHFVHDSDFRQILQRRASNCYREELAKVQEQERKQRHCQSTLATTHNEASAPVTRSVPSSQQHLFANLQALDNFLSRLPPDRKVVLQPGVYPEQIDKLNQVLAPLQIPQDLAVLYQWHNSFDHGGHLFGVPDLLVMEDALVKYRDAVKLGEQFSWSKVFFPLCYGDNGYRLIILSEGSRPQTPVYLYYPEEGVLTQQFDTIQSMLETYLIAYTKITHTGKSMMRNSPCCATNLIRAV